METRDARGCEGVRIGLHEFRPKEFSAQPFSPNPKSYRKRKVSSAWARIFTELSGRIEILFRLVALPTLIDLHKNLYFY
jgi:hypothetical protein